MHRTNAVFMFCFFCVAQFMWFSTGLSVAGSSIAQAKLSGGQVCLTNKVVTGVFQGATGTIIYIQDPPGSGYVPCGICVQPDVLGTISIGSMVEAAGTVCGSPTYYECIIKPAYVEVIGSSPLPEPLVLTNKSTAGGAFGLQPALRTGMFRDGLGVNPVGMRVTVCGKVTSSYAESGKTVHFIDDGSNLASYATRGVKVVYEAGCMEPVRSAGNFVVATGILGADKGRLSYAAPVVRVCVTVSDPPVVTDDGDYTSSATELHATWTDSNSNTTEYSCAVGTQPGSADMKGWASVAMARETVITGLSLSPGAIYYISVKCKGADGKWSAVGSSNGIAVDISKISVMGDNRNVYAGGSVPKYEKFESTFSMSSLGTPYVDYNPFNPNLGALSANYYDKKGVAVDALITRPGDTAPSIVWPCFFYESFTSDFSTKTGYCWKLRFAPTSVGTWKYKLRVRYGSTISVSGTNSFECVAALPNNHGFLSVNQADSRLFRFSDGTTFYPVGCSFSGLTTDPTLTMPSTFADMQAVGANFSRVFLNVLNLERNCEGTRYQTLNSFQNSQSNSMGLIRAGRIDLFLDEAREHGIYLEWLLDDWTYVKDSTQNPYIATTGRPGPCIDSDDFFVSVAGQEVYKRKLRYWMARWGYSTNLMAVDLINEIDISGSPKEAWHNLMADYVHSYSFQPHMVSSSNGSEWLAKRGVDWTSSSIDFVNYHDFAKYTNQWNVFHCDYPLDQLGIYDVWPLPSARGTCPSVGYPWIDGSVWVDRVARAYYRLGWNKPMVWSEYGLINRDCTNSGFSDWDSIYTIDSTAQHFREAIWSGLFKLCGVTHWKLDYMRGTAPYSSGGNKIWVLAPLSHFIAGEDLTGLVPETAYHVADPINPSPKIKCLQMGTTTPNAKVMAMSLRKTGMAWVYVKNLSDSWASLVDQTEPMYDIAPATNYAVAATIRLDGMSPGSYSLETWSTTDPDQTTQKLSTTSISVGSDGVALFDAQFTGNSLAYKLKKSP